MTSAGVLHCATLGIQPHDGVCSTFRAAVPAIPAVMIKLGARIAPPATENLMRLLISACFAAVSALACWHSAALAAPSHAIAMHGEPALPADFPHFPYANPDAPKGGRIDYAWPGSFDSLNPFIVQGWRRARHVRPDFGNNVFETLMVRSRDEAFTLYPLIAAIDRDRPRPHAMSSSRSTRTRQILRRHSRSPG